MERQNGALRSALGRAAAAPRAAGLVRGELRGLRERLQRLGRERERLQGERDGLAAELQGLRRRCAAGGGEEGGGGIAKCIGEGLGVM